MMVFQEFTDRCVHLVPKTSIENEPTELSHAI
jgi:hypothetical protein